MSEEIKIDGIPIQDYGTPNSRSCYPEEINIGETIKNNIDYWKNLYFEEKEKNKELKEELDRQINTRIINEEFIEKNYISKDKIRAKIKQIEDAIEPWDDEDLRYQLKIEDKAQIEVLKELLEEE